MDYELCWRINCIENHFSWECYWCLEQTQRKILTRWFVFLKYNILLLWIFFGNNLRRIFLHLYVFVFTPLCVCYWCEQCQTSTWDSRSIHFLTRLNDSFNLVRSQILLMNSLPTLNKIFSMVMQHKRQFKASIFDESNILINSADYHIS